MITETVKGITFTRVRNDINGNPRYVVHFLRLLTRRECETLSLSNCYALALKKSRRFGGRKYHNREYGGGIVFQSYNLTEQADMITEMNGGRYLDPWITGNKHD